MHGYSKPGLESDVLQLDEFNEIFTFEPRMVSLEPGPEFKARYDILEELGKGRFGVVHKVVDKTNSQKLAAKFIRCRTAKDRDKVQEEIEIMNQLRHQKLLQLAAAFENPREMIMVTEYISGGELFERVVADDFTLTEKDCILFMRQICEGVAYMHSQDIVHLDLKPENIMCHTRTSHEIKIIDFGLAQKLDPDKPTRVLFGTPEFIPPEIINYEPIGLKSDMWSIGVICYVLLSGLSPFMGDNDAETFANITRADYDFDDEAFNTVSQNARDFIAALLINKKEDRLSAEQSLKHTWLDPENHQNTVILSTDKLKKFIIRRKWQKTGNAIRALGRMATLSASRRNSANNSTPNTPRPSLTGSTVNSMMMSRMSSLNEENMFIDELTTSRSMTIADTVEEVKQSEENLNDVTEIKVTDPEVEGVTSEPEGTWTVEETTVEDISNNNVIKRELVEEKRNEKCESTRQSSPDVTETYISNNGNCSPKAVKVRSCTERSDSGISCSSHLTSSSCTSTPLLGKKFSINEEAEFRRPNIADSNESLNFTASKLVTLTSKFESKENLTSKDKDLANPSEECMRNASRCRGVNIKLEDKIGTFENGKSPSSTTCLKKVPMYSTYTSRSVANAIKKFDLLDKTQPDSQTTIKHSNSRLSDLKIEIKPPIPSAENLEKSKERNLDKSVERNLDKLHSSNKDNISRSRSPCIKINNNDSLNSSKLSTSESLKSTQIDKVEIKSFSTAISSRLNKFDKTDNKILNGNKIEVPKQSLRYRSPSPSLLRKTQAVIAKEQNNERYLSQLANKNITNGTKSKINSTPRKDKPQSEKFQRVAAFWNTPKT
ncbi:hypothetical protein HHI36_018973 [Cryptolaemus montrouzieri]|uniref:Protein kinase domain-containing protein n=1 Tax=Cryptolaemus montrouzieri TaxID=559131 RepID=A0ABD2P1S4_9CUCU